MRRRLGLQPLINRDVSDPTLVQLQVEADAVDEERRLEAAAARRAEEEQKRRQAESQATRRALEKAELPQAAPPTILRRGCNPLLWIPLLLAAAYIRHHELVQAAHSLVKLLGLAAVAAAPAVPEKGEEIGDVVDASAFAPTSGCAGEDVLVQIFFHALEKRRAAAALAREADPEARERGLTTLAVPVQRGQRIDILVEAAGVTVDEPQQALIWHGEPRSCQFVLSLPAELVGRTCQIKARMLVASNLCWHAALHTRSDRSCRDPRPRHAR